MKKYTLLLILPLAIILFAFSAESTSSVSVTGTVVRVSQEKRGCEFGSLVVRSYRDNGTGYLTFYQFSDMSNSRKAQLESLQGKIVSIKINTKSPAFGCNTASLQVQEM